MSVGSTLLALQETDLALARDKASLADMPEIKQLAAKRKTYLKLKRVSLPPRSGLLTLPTTIRYKILRSSFPTMQSNSIRWLSIGRISKPVARRHLRARNMHRMSSSNTNEASSLKRRLRVKKLPGSRNRFLQVQRSGPRSLQRSIIMCLFAMRPR